MPYSNDNLYVLYKYQDECIFKVKIVTNEDEAKKWSADPGCFYTKAEKEKKFLCY